MVNPSSSFTNNAMTDMAMGNITTAVDVLLIHILKLAVAIMNPNITLLGVVPVSFMIFRAMRLCRFTFSRAGTRSRNGSRPRSISIT